MTTDMYDENLILGYVEDTLTAEEKALFEQLLQTDARLASLVNSMRQDCQLLNTLDQVTAPMELGDYVSAQLERQMLLGPLPQRRKVIPSSKSTPQSRSHSRFMRIGAYGSLAAMFLVVVGLMYQHIGSQSLIERTGQMSFDSQADDGKTVVMKQSQPQTNSIDELLKLPPIPAQIKSKDKMEMSKERQVAQPQSFGAAMSTPIPAIEALAKSDDRATDANMEPAIPQPLTVTTAPTPIRANVKVDQREVMQLGSETASARRMSLPSAAAPAATTKPDADLLRELSPTTAVLAGTVDADTSHITNNAATPTTSDLGDLTSTASGQASPPPAPASSTLSWTGSDKAAGEAESISARPSAPVTTMAVAPSPKLVADGVMTAGDTIRSRAGLQSDSLNMPADMPDKTLPQQVMQQQPSVCVIQSQQPEKTVTQITQWALRNKVQIIDPIKPELKKSEEVRKPADLSAKALTKHAPVEQPLRQVITLNMPASQVPVLVSWLNQQKSQLNNWISPMPQSNAPNRSFQRLQQEIPLAPTIPLIKPDEALEVQLMVVPDPRKDAGNK